MAFLQVPEIVESQSSKYITHNEAIRILRILAQIKVKDRHLTAPPGSPAQGDCYIPAATASGAWVGKENYITFYSGSAWVFLLPDNGWIAYALDESIFIYWTGSQWTTLP